jgi:site-specific DNA-cytosine methylase
MYVDLMDAMTRAQVKWHPGENTTIALRKLYRAGGTVPEPWARKLDKHVGTDFDLGINQTMMWDPEKQGHVVTGMGPVHSVHYSERRLFTYREVARIQGFPDTWQIWPSRNYTHIGSVWGKGVPVDAARWLGKWIALALEDNPGTVRGEPIGFRETKVDFTNSFKHTLDAERLWEHQRYVLHEYVANEDYERESA